MYASSWTDFNILRLYYMVRIFSFSNCLRWFNSLVLFLISLFYLSHTDLMQSETPCKLSQGKVTVIDIFKLLQFAENFNIFNPFFWLMCSPFALTQL
jgi:hypothetical protein